METRDITPTSNRTTAAEIESHPPRRPLATYIVALCCLIVLPSCEEKQEDYSALNLLLGMAQAAPSVSAKALSCMSNDGLTCSQIDWTATSSSAPRSAFCSNSSGLVPGNASTTLYCGQRWPTFMTTACSAPQTLKGHSARTHLFYKGGSWNSTSITNNCNIYPGSSEITVSTTIANKYDPAQNPGVND